MNVTFERSNRLNALFAAEYLHCLFFAVVCGAPVLCSAADGVIRATGTIQPPPRIFTYVMAAIAGISLLVGGIGIMNVVLATYRSWHRQEKHACRNGCPVFVRGNMSKSAAFLLAATLTNVPAMLFAQQTPPQNPDQQQEGKPETKPAPKTTQPKTDTTEPQSGQSPDIQQEKNGSTASRPHKKNKNNAQQGHGTPKPKTATTPQ
jgi:hypothetical protein